MAGHRRAPSQDFEQPISAALRVYAPAAAELYSELLGTEREMVRELALAAGASPGGSWPTLPVLHHDTAVLDVEEDRVIWVRERDLGKAVVAQP